MSTPSRRSAADVLLELLGKVPDAATLELLLEPEHLLRLLRVQGWSEADVRRELTARGRSPGELLLAVLARQPDPSVLLNQLGNPAPLVTRRAAGAPRKPAGIAALVVGALLAAPSGWYLFVRLDVLHVPGLARHFPGAYALLAAVLLSGLVLLAVGVRTLAQRPQ